jgi:hypothetical protein
MKIESTQILVKSGGRAARPRRATPPNPTGVVGGGPRLLLLTHAKVYNFILSFNNLVIKLFSPQGGP